MARACECDRCGKVFKRHSESWPRVPHKKGLSYMTWSERDVCDECGEAFQALLDEFWKGGKR